MTIRRALAVCIAYIREISGNDNVYGLGESISLTDLDAMVANPPSAQGENLCDILLTAMANEEIDEDFFCADIRPTGDTVYGMSQLEGYLCGLNAGLRCAGISLTVKVETMNVLPTRTLQTFTGYLGEAAQ